MAILGMALAVLAAGYIVIGVGVGMRFATVTAAQFNERAEVGSFPFRMLLIPGGVVLWPLIVRRGAAGFSSEPPHGRLTVAPPEVATPEAARVDAGPADAGRVDARAQSTGARGSAGERSAPGATQEPSSK